MSRRLLSKGNFLIVASIVIALLLPLTGCSKQTEEKKAASSEKFVIQNAGSDTIVNLAQTWAERYAEVNPSVSVEVSGGGSGTGVAALINGTVDIANSSRQMEPDEMQKAKQSSGKDPERFVVGHDALAVYIHKDNPLNEITVQQLAQMYGERGGITKWSQLGIKNTACASDEIILISRQSNSGTYHYFREALLGKERDFRLGSRDLNGSKDIVELVERTPCAIGYSGMGYATPGVKTLKIAKAAGEAAHEPSIEMVLNGAYVLSRPLYMYTLGDPPKEIAKYMEWIYSDTGQEIVAESGYVPLPKEELEAARKALQGRRHP